MITQVNNIIKLCFLPYFLIKNDGFYVYDGLYVNFNVYITPLEKICHYETENNVVVSLACHITGEWT